MMLNWFQILLLLGCMAVIFCQTGKYEVMRYMQKNNHQKCMQCPEFNITKICGFDEYEKNPKLYCGGYSVDYLIFWSNHTCMKALISCSTRTYVYAYIQGGQTGNHTENKFVRRYQTRYLVHDKFYTSGMFYCNQNSQWEYISQDKKKRIKTTENISCLYSKVGLYNADD